MGSVCSSSPPSHFSLFQTVNLGSGLTVLFPHFHGSEPSNVFTCKMPGDLRLFWPEDGVARPPPRLDGSRGGRGHWSCSLFSEGGVSPLAVEQGLSREDVGSASALDSGEWLPPIQCSESPGAVRSRLTTYQLWGDEQVICPFCDSVSPSLKCGVDNSCLLGCRRGPILACSC